MYRLFAIAVVLFWISAMSALFVRDVWPAWTAQDPPVIKLDQLAGLERRDEQYDIARSDGQRLGTAWSTVNRNGPYTAIHGMVLLDGLGDLPTLSMQTNTVFDEQGQLARFTLNVHGVPMTRIRVHGERRGIYFPCELHLGPIHREIRLDAAASRMISESLRPFDLLPELKVGQSWRMQLLDPLSAALSAQADFTSIVATVTGTEKIEYPAGGGQYVECFVVEASPGRTKAWVDKTGRVLAQEVEMPGFGRIGIRQEPLDETRRQAALDHVRRSAAQITEDRRDWDNDALD